MLGTEMKTPMTKSTCVTSSPPEREPEVAQDDAPTPGAAVLLQKGRVPTVAALCNAEWRRSNQRLPALSSKRGNKDKKVRISERTMERRMSDRKLLSRGSKFDLQLNAHLKMENRFSKLSRSTEVARSQTEGATMTSQLGTDKPLSRGMSGLLGEDTFSRIDNLMISGSVSKSQSGFKDSGYYSDGRKQLLVRTDTMSKLSPRVQRRTPQTVTTSDVQNLNVTLLDIANLTQKTVASREPRENVNDTSGFATTQATQQSAAPPVTGELSIFNTFKEIERFRNLLRQEDLEAQARQERKAMVATPRGGRVNYCDPGKSERIEAWLQDVYDVQRREGLCEQTTEECIQEDSPQGHVQNINVASID